MDSTPQGKHMEMNTFKESLEFIKKMNPLVLLVTGGEPLEHPDFFKMIEDILKIQPKETIMITTNGMFLYNQELTKRVLDLGVKIQVTNDIRYYPQRINMNVKHENLVYETHIRSLTPIGRAKTNGMNPINSTAPKCFNIRSIACNNATSLFSAIKLLEGHFKFCEPSIDIDGSIKAGEGGVCTSIGTVTMSEHELYSNLINLK
jgi:hypothetical protein